MIHKNFTDHHFSFRLLPDLLYSFGLKFNPMKKLYLLSFILILLPAIITAQDRDLKNRFYNGITAEEIEGDLDKAINIYQDILNADDVDRQLKPLVILI